MKNKLIKIIPVVIMVFMILVAFTGLVNANSDFNPWNSVSAENSTAAGSVGTIAGQILGIVQVVGYAVAVIMLVVLAIKYIAASPNEKAEIKKSAMTYVIGAFLLFGASFVLGIIKDFAGSVKN